MWSNILTEANYQANFNTQFPNDKVDVLLHLAQWQYWWWFWFTFLWGMYYLLLARTLRYRTLKFRPKIVSSFRPHGKWGDAIICLLPVSWCGNILINSNLLLKLIEWQAESSLFTIRIRGKQWYWVYKFDFKHFTDVMSTPKNVGTNKWAFSFFGELKTSDNYLHILQMRAQNKWIKQYWVKNLGKFEQEEKTNLNVVQESLPIDNSNSFSTPVNSKLTNLSSNFANVNYANLSVNALDFSYTNSTTSIKNSLKHFGCNFRELFNDLNNTNNHILKNNLIDFMKSSKTYMKITKKSQDLNVNYNYKTFTLHEDSTRDVKNYMGKPTPLTLVKIPVNKLNDLVDNTYYMFKFRFNDKNSTLSSKNGPKVPYFAFKQQRYKARKLIPMVTKKYTDELGNEHSVKNNFTLNNTYSMETDMENPSRHYRMLRKNKVRSEKMPVVVSKRLLRVKKTLVLPTHINITAVTNSYDVVHSWFIPGLGLKMDCVPGRSTHHTFYVDNSGFYYGQCAEICGRYHHHMPIRVCALPFEHFLVWWHSFGLPKLMYPGKKYKMMKSYSFRKFAW
jgi:heme/copper-type cytochrome/quinol oxidase subunit 2